LTLPIQAIINRRWARQLERFSADGPVRYWINGKARTLRDGTRVGAISAAEASFIRTTLAEVDRLTGLELVELGSRSRSVLDFYRVGGYGPGASDQLGEITMYRSFYEITWADRGGQRLTRSEQWTILHEIGHGLGLDHPYGKPFSSRYDSSDTVMSYNPSGRGGSAFTTTDLQALQSLWGIS
jgi:hypothetical protein